MTGYDSDTPIGGEPYDGEPAVLDSEPVDGEVVLWEAPRTRQRRHNAFVDPDVVEEIVRKRIKGATLKALGAEYGISHETVRQWCGEAVKKTRVASADILALRARLTLELETLKNAAWQEFETNAHQGVRRDALTRVESAVRAIADLNGAKAPVVVKAEVSVTELTQEDLKLQEMIREAQAREAAQIEAEFKAGG